jgi:uncharacterized protein (TIGR03435 family)
MTEPCVSRLDLHAKRLLIVLGAIALATPCTQGQQSPAIAPAPAATTALPTLVYDVASVRKFMPDGGPMMISTRTDPDGLTATHVQVKSLICLAYDVSDYQVIGGPEWASSDFYDVRAKMDDSTIDTLRNLSPEQKTLVREHMAQALLADRFKLVVHHETKQFPIYALVVAKGGPKLLESKPNDDYKDGIKGFDGQPGGKGMMRMQRDSGGFVFTAQGYSMDKFADQLSMQLRSNVQNDTGLKADYDFTLRYSPEDARVVVPNPSGAGGSASLSDNSGISIFTAVQDQLGLRLESTKGPLDVIVIDHIERPSEN